MSKYENLFNNFRVDQKEWDQFWSWMWYNTGNHGFGPLRTILHKNPKEQEKLEQEMLFFLTHKKRILTNPPVGKEKERFNDQVMNIR